MYKTSEQLLNVFFYDMLRDEYVVHLVAPITVAVSQRGLNRSDEKQQRHTKYFIDRRYFAEIHINKNESDFTTPRTGVGTSFVCLLAVPFVVSNFPLRNFEDFASNVILT